MNLHHIGRWLVAGVCLVATPLMANASWSEPVSPMAVASLDPDDRWLSDIEALVLRDRLGTPAEAHPFTLRISASEHPSGDLRMLLEYGEPWHLAQFGAVATSPVLDARLSAYGRLGYLPRTARPAASSDEREEPASIGMKAEMADFELGAEYRSVGQRLDRVLSLPQIKDQEGIEVWLGRRLGVFRLRLSQSELTDNVDRNPALPRTTRIQTAVTAEASPRDWPVLAFRYASGDSERVHLMHDGDSSPPERRTFASVTASAYYHASAWDLAASSTYEQTRDLRGVDDAEMLYHDLSLTIRPIEGLSAVSAISIGQERSLVSGVRSDTASTSLTLWYVPSMSCWSAWTAVSHTTMQASDRTVDARNLSVSGGLSYDLGKLPIGRTSLSFETGYDRYRDGVSPAGSAQTVFGLVLLKIAAF